jgi:hypothetical protein
MNSAINLWGPALLVCFTVLIGIVMNNKRIDDLRSDFKGQIDGVEKRLNGRIDDLRSDLVARIDGLEKRLVDRLERLEHPVIRA